MCARDKLSETLEVFSPKSEPSPRTAKLIQYYRLKQKHEQMRKKAGNGEEKCEKMKEKPDFLAIVTEYSRTCFEALSQKTSETLQKCGIKRTPKLRAMSKCIFLLMLAIVVGIFLQETQIMDDREVNRPLWTLLYTICFGTYLGTQTWMALVSGVVLYFSLPRHTFGAVQIKLFPFFYFHNTVMSFLIFLAFTRLQHGFVPWSPEAYQMTSITAALIVQMFVWLLVAPQIVELRNIRTGMEEAAGVGQEIGRVEMAALRHCPRYQAILSRFRRLHLMVTFFTVIILGLSIWHACYLSKKVCM